MTKISIWDHNNNAIVNKRISKFKKEFSKKGRESFRKEGYGLTEGLYQFYARDESLADSWSYRTKDIKIDPYFNVNCEYIYTNIYQFELFEEKEASALIIINEALKYLIKGRMVVLLEEQNHKINKYYGIEIPYQKGFVTIISNTLNFDMDDLFLKNFKNVLFNYFKIELDEFDIRNNVIETLNYLKLTSY